MSQKRYDQLRNQVAKRIQAILDDKEWSMSHFSEQLHKSKSHVSSILNAKSNLTLRVIAEMEEVLGEKIMEVK